MIQRVESRPGVLMAYRIVNERGDMLHFLGGAVVPTAAYIAATQPRAPSLTPEERWELRLKRLLTDRSEFMALRQDTAMPCHCGSFDISAYAVPWADNRGVRETVSFWVLENLISILILAKI